MDARTRIAIYGGTFDPVHLGHLEIARRVCELFSLSRLLFVPARVAPHKVDRQVSPSFHRYAMLALATEAEPQLCISTFELEGPERRYTVETLAHFRSQLGGSADLFFVMGADSWAEVSTWREWEKLMTMVNYIVVTRPGYEFSAEHIGPTVAARVVDVRGFAPEAILPKVNSGMQRIFVTDAVMADVSATEIRRAAQENQTDALTRMVPLGVAQYILKYGLYRATNET